MLSEEEKKAMKYFYNFRATIDESIMLFDEDLNVKCGKETIYQITTILNLIEKQQAEIEKKNRIIKIMAIAIDQTSALRTGIGCRIKNEECNMNGCEKCIIEYFTNKVEEENK